MQRILNELVERLTKTFGDRLVSVVLYGSAAAGDYDQKFSDLNVLCVLTQVTPRELRDSERIFRWWRYQDNPSPLLMSESEVRASTDCFPIEFHDMTERRRILAGSDVIAGLSIDDRFYRAQVEHELRAKLLRLRQKAAGVLNDGDLLRRLLIDSVSTFCVLFRHALRLAGHNPTYVRREIIDEVRRRFQADPQPFLTVLSMRENSVNARNIDPVPLLESYIAEISTVVRAVDAIDPNRTEN